MSECKLIVITGVTSGIGHALVEWFVGHGHTVIGCGRREEKIFRLKKQFNLKKCDFSVLDVSDVEGVVKWSKDIIDTYGPPDLLVNNAAIANKPNYLWKVPLNEFDSLIDVNIKAVNYVIHSYLPAMIERGRGVIVNISSGWGRCTAPETAPYCTTKWAVEGLSMALAQELPPPLACVPLNPGMINTDMLESFFGDQAKDFPTPKIWAEKAAPFLLALSRGDNGKRLTAPPWDQYD